MLEEMNQNREQCSSSSEHLSSVRGIPPLNPRNVNFMQRPSKKTGIAAAYYCQEKWLHLPESLWQLGRNRSIVTIESPIAFLPSISSFTPKLFAKVFAHERMRIQSPRIVGIFGS